MITLDVTTDNQSGIAGMLSGLRGQLPFALSVAINDTVNQVQTAIQNTLAPDFTLRRPDFIANTIYRKPGQDFASKDRLVGAVRVNPDPKRDMLSKFEDGGAKTSTTEHALAIPIMRARNPQLVIRRGDPLSIKNVMEAIVKREGRMKLRRRKSDPIGPLQALGDVFLMKTPKGTLVLQRPVSGPDRTGNRSHLTVLYEFKHSVPIKPDLHFDETALRVALERWEPNYQRAIELAMNTIR